VHAVNRFGNEAGSIVTR